MLKMPENLPEVEPGAMVRYDVTATTPRGVMLVENIISTQGPEAAGKRAFFTLVHAGYGDLDEVTIDAVEVATLAPGVFS